MGKLNFQGYLILQFHPTCKICENLINAKKCVVQFISSFHFHTLVPTFDLTPCFMGGYQNDVCMIDCSDKDLYLSIVCLYR